MVLLAVEVEDREMQRLIAAARACHIDASNLDKRQLTLLLAMNGMKGVKGEKAIKRRRWNKPGVFLKARAALSSIELITPPSKTAVVHFGRRLALQKRISQYELTKKALATTSPMSTDPDHARAKRLAAALKVFGMWKDNPDKPQDGLAYQREARSEW